MENEFLFKIAKDYFDNIKPPFRHPLTGRPSFHQLHFGHDMSKKAINRATKSFAKYKQIEEQPILLYQQLFFRMVIGLLVTNKCIYYNLYGIGIGDQICGKYYLNEVSSFKIIYQKNWIVYVNEVPIGEFGGLESVRSEIDIIVELINKIVNALRQYGNSYKEGNK
ncbi:MAG: hypothetical protein ACM3NT_05760 [Methylocystaceae bacterium]